MPQTSLHQVSNSHEIDVLRKEREIELSVSRERSKIELEKSRIELIVERTLTRQKLLNAGISLADVDWLLPESS